MSPSWYTEDCGPRQLWHRRLCKRCRGSFQTADGDALMRILLAVPLTGDGSSSVAFVVTIACMEWNTRLLSIFFGHCDEIVLMLLSSSMLPIVKVFGKVFSRLPVYAFPALRCHQLLHRACRMQTCC
ncbi:hypothetical protein MPSEU_000628300 [Mayamaea pseudoterrestris]|nr:hypothetical protein MPSEU_000628300 [Mayamaea pseudoterrestris]